ncbi:MAG: bifunctional GrpB family protein/GNAT family N-acetyltransferase [Alphaproteobacteria bacterium]|nr:bifunctional GrpB family protein/GNAT family N-acetyltransferase [Alphaproteobacteria bacterium]
MALTAILIIKNTWNFEMLKAIEVIPYNSNWPLIFEKEAALLRQSLADNCIAIYHIGSTSVPGLAAKEDIDICVVVQHLQKSLEHYAFKGEINIPLRYFFSKNSAESKVNLHMVEADHGFLTLNLCFTEYLRSHDEDRLAYARLKYELLQSPEAHTRSNMNFTGYTLGKYQFINDILDKAGFNAVRLMHCMHPVEWAAAKHFRDTYFFAPCGIKDGYTWTFNHIDHAHLVLYEGTQIIAYAHVEFLPDHRSLLRMLVVDKNKRNMGFGSRLLSLMEKWLKSLDIKSFHLTSRQSSLRFYLKNGYAKIPFDASTCMSYDLPKPGLEGHISDKKHVTLGKIL